MKSGINCRHQIINRFLDTFRQDETMTLKTKDNQQCSFSGADLTTRRKHYSGLKGFVEFAPRCLQHKMKPIGRGHF